jgi:hypothetical protein
MDSSDRRNFVKNIGGIAIGAVAGSGVTQMFSKDAYQHSAVQAIPWPYVTLDPVAVAERAYAGYSNGGCMYGAFEGIIGELRTQLGAPYDTFPTTMMKYGGGGINGWGTICGTLNGIAAALYIVLDATNAGNVISEVFTWFGSTALPNYTPKNPKYPTVVSLASESQLCHVSVTKWANKANLSSGSPERADRCAWLTASVAKYTTEMINAVKAGTFKATHTSPAEVTLCLQCHSKTGTVANVNIAGANTCTSCHKHHWGAGVEF